MFEINKLRDDELREITLEEAIEMSKKIFEEEDKVRKEIVKRVKNSLNKNPDVEEVILFGSTARMDSTRKNDVDFLIMFKGDPEEIFEISKDVMKTNPERIIHLTFISKSDLEEALSDGKEPYKMFRFERYNPLYKKVPIDGVNRLGKVELVHNGKLRVWTINNFNSAGLANTLVFSGLMEPEGWSKRMLGYYALPFFDEKVNPKIHSMIYLNPRLMYDGLLKVSRNKILFDEGVVYNGNLIDLIDSMDGISEDLVARILYLRVNERHVPKKDIRLIKGEYIRTCHDIVNGSKPF